MSESPRSCVRTGAAFFVWCTIVGIPAVAAAELSRDDLRCGATIGREASRFAAAKHEAIVACNNDVVRGRTCNEALRDRRIDRAMDRLRRLILRRCADADLAALGFPGACPVNGGPFSVGALADCLVTTHMAQIDLAVDVQYPALAPRSGANRQCQRTIGRAGQSFIERVLRVGARCFDLQRKGRIALTVDCGAATVGGEPATGDPRTDRAIRQAVADLARALARACGAADLAALGFPGPGPSARGSGFSVADLLDLIVDSHGASIRAMLDTSSPGAPFPTTTPPGTPAPTDTALPSPATNTPITTPTAMETPFPTDTPLSPAPTDTPLPPAPTDTPLPSPATNTPITTPTAMETPFPTDTPLTPAPTNTPLPPAPTDTPQTPPPTTTVEPTETPPPTATVTVTATATPTATATVTTTPTPSPTVTETPPPAETETPTPSPTATAGAFRVDECEGVVTEMTVQYTGEGCTGSDTQDGKFSCAGDPSFAEPVQIVPSDPNIVANPDGPTIMVGDFIVLVHGFQNAGRFPTNFGVDIKQGTTVVQSLTIHTSCSPPIEENDKFGALMVAGLEARENRFTCDIVAGGGNCNATSGRCDSGPLFFTPCTTDDDCSVCKLIPGNPFGSCAFGQRTDSLHDAALGGNVLIEIGPPVAGARPFTYRHSNVEAVDLGGGAYSCYSYTGTGAVECAGSSTGGFNWQLTRDHDTDPNSPTNFVEGTPDDAGCDDFTIVPPALGFTSPARREGSAEAHPGLCQSPLFVTDLDMTQAPDGTATFGLDVSVEVHPPGNEGADGVRCTKDDGTPASTTVATLPASTGSVQCEVFDAKTPIGPTTSGNITAGSGDGCDEDADCPAGEACFGESSGDLFPCPGGAFPCFCATVCGARACLTGQQGSLIDCAQMNTGTFFFDLGVAAPHLDPTQIFAFDPNHPGADPDLCVSAKLGFFCEEDPEDDGSSDSESNSSDSDSTDEDSDSSDSS